MYALCIADKITGCSVAAIGRLIVEHLDVREAAPVFAGRAAPPATNHIP
jgi:hypothetical protein